MVNVIMVSKRITMLCIIMVLSCRMSCVHIGVCACVCLCMSGRAIRQTESSIESLQINPVAACHKERIRRLSLNQQLPRRSKLLLLSGGRTFVRSITAKNSLSPPKDFVFYYTQCSPGLDKSNLRK